MTGESNGPPVVGIDLGGTKILAGVVDGGHQILARSKRNTPAREGGPAILAAVIECVDEALGAARLSRASVAAGGIGSPGPLDTKAGVILFSANLNVKNYPIGPELSAALGWPVLVQNDVRVGGYAEHQLGAARGYASAVIAFVGTGIGGCLIQNGEIVAGATGNAGEIGHMTIKAGGPPCGCGGRGCLEALASKTAIARRVGKAVRRVYRPCSPKKCRAKADGSRAATWPKPWRPRTWWRSRRFNAPPISWAWPWEVSSTCSGRRSSLLEGAWPMRSEILTSISFAHRPAPRRSPTLTA